MALAPLIKEVILRGRRQLEERKKMVEFPRSLVTVDWLLIVFRYVIWFLIFVLLFCDTLSASFRFLFSAWDG